MITKQFLFNGIAEFLYERNGIWFKFRVEKVVFRGRDTYYFVNFWGNERWSYLGKIDSNGYLRPTRSTPRIYTNSLPWIHFQNILDWLWNRMKLDNCEITSIGKCGYCGKQLPSGIHKGIGPKCDRLLKESVSEDV